MKGMATAQEQLDEVQGAISAVLAQLKAMEGVEDHQTASERISLSKQLQTLFAERRALQQAVNLEQGGGFSLFSPV